MSILSSLCLVSVDHCESLPLLVACGLGDWMGREVELFGPAVQNPEGVWDSENPTHVHFYTKDPCRAEQLAEELQFTLEKYQKSLRTYSLEE